MRMNEIAQQQQQTENAAASPAHVLQKKEA
jgi:hypothetical protein